MQVQRQQYRYWYLENGDRHEGAEKWCPLRHRCWSWSTNPHTWWKTYPNFSWGVENIYVAAIWRLVNRRSHPFPIRIECSARSSLSLILPNYLGGLFLDDPMLYVAEGRTTHLRNETVTDGKDKSIKRQQWVSYSFCFKPSLVATQQHTHHVQLTWKLEKWWFQIPAGIHWWNNSKLQTMRGVAIVM